jgi:Pyridoxamine 5'-phosphate oxidase
VKTKAQCRMPSELLIHVIGRSGSWQYMSAVLRMPSCIGRRPNLCVPLNARRYLILQPTLTHRRYYQVATVGTDGRPSNRTVVHRDFYGDNALTWCTDQR